MPAYHHFDAAFGAKLNHYSDGTEFVTDGENGIKSMLARHMNVPRRDFTRYLERILELGIRQDVAKVKAVKSSHQVKLPVWSTWLQAWQSWPKSCLGLPMLHPYSRPAIMWMIFIMVMDLIYTAFWVPLNVAFCSKDYGALPSACTVADLSGGVVYTLNLLMSFQIGAVVVSNYKKITVMDGWVVMHAYIHHGRFLLDLAGALPFVYLVVIVAGQINSSRWVAVVSLVRLVRMIRLVSLTQVIYIGVSADKGSGFIKMLGGVPVVHSLLLVYVLTIVVNLEACLLLLVAEFAGLENSWMSSLTWIDLADSPAIYQWYVSFYAAVSSNTGTGLAGMGYRNSSEFAVCIILQCMGMIMFSLLVTVGIQNITRVSEQALVLYKLREKMKRVHLWMDIQKLPDHINQQIKEYFQEVWTVRDRNVEEDTVVADMPNFLRAGLLLPLTADVVRQVHFLSTLQTMQKDLIAANMRPIKIRSGVDLCAEGDENDCMWLLEEGEVVALSYKNPPQYLIAPCMFGESVLLYDSLGSCRERLFTYRTAKECKAWRIHMKDLKPILQSFPELPGELMTYVQSKLLKMLNLEPDDGHWCEIVSKLLVTIEDLPANIRAELVELLKQASLADNTLEPLLDILLEVVLVSKAEAGVVRRVLSTEQGVIPGLARFSTMARTDSLARSGSYRSAHSIPRNLMANRASSLPRAHERLNTQDNAAFDKWENSPAFWSQGSTPVGRSRLETALGKVWDRQAPDSAGPSGSTSSFAPSSGTPPNVDIQASVFANPAAALLVEDSFTTSFPSPGVRPSPAVPQQDNGSRTLSAANTLSAPPLPAQPLSSSAVSDVASLSAATSSSVAGLPGMPSGLTVAPGARFRPSRFRGDHSADQLGYQPSDASQPAADSPTSQLSGRAALPQQVDGAAAESPQDETMPAQQQASSESQADTRLADNTQPLNPQSSPFALVGSSTSASEAPSKAHTQPAGQPPSLGTLASPAKRPASPLPSASLPDIPVPLASSQLQPSGEGPSSDNDIIFHSNPLPSKIKVPSRLSQVSKLGAAPGQDGPDPGTGMAPSPEASELYTLEPVDEGADRPSLDVSPGRSPAIRTDTAAGPDRGDEGRRSSPPTVRRNASVGYEQGSEGRRSSPGLPPSRSPRTLLPTLSQLLTSSRSEAGIVSPGRSPRTHHRSSMEELRAALGSQESAEDRPSSREVSAQLPTLSLLLQGSQSQAGGSGSLSRSSRTLGASSQMPTLELLQQSALAGVRDRLHSTLRPSSMSQLPASLSSGLDSTLSRGSRGLSVQSPLARTPRSPQVAPLSPGSGFSNARSRYSLDEKRVGSGELDQRQQQQQETEAGAIHNGEQQVAPLSPPPLPRARSTGGSVSNSEGPVPSRQLLLQAQGSGPSHMAPVVEGCPGHVCPTCRNPVCPDCGMFCGH